MEESVKGEMGAFSDVVGSPPCLSPRLANEFTRDISAGVPRAIIGDYRINGVLLHTGRDVGIPSRCLLYADRDHRSPTDFVNVMWRPRFSGQSVLFGCFQRATDDMAPPTEAGGSPIRKPADQLLLQPEYYQA